MHNNERKKRSYKTLETATAMKIFGGWMQLMGGNGLISQNLLNGMHARDILSMTPM